MLLVLTSNSNHNQNQNQNQQEIENIAPMKTWVPLSLSPAEYIKLGQKIGMDPKELEENSIISAIDKRRFQFVNQTKGNYKRIVTSIKKVRTDDDKVWLDWNEQREGKTGIGRKLDPLTVPNVGKKNIPVPREETVFDEESESYDVKVTIGRETREEYWLPFSIEALNELLKDVNPYRTEYIIKHENRDAYTVTNPDELKQDFLT